MDYFMDLIRALQRQADELREEFQSLGQQLVRRSLSDAEREHLMRVRDELDDTERDIERLERMERLDEVDRSGLVDAAGGPVTGEFS
ncbi:hypothetical protein [Amycolatopsis anabasis]|uniref:hypothetical protein n=1 Tax=Amycolatopsis anabasis TaxID=1840409 RepID=UPI00131AF141|nr:hypothetical protein [Amycolatopsis anabasis]